MEDAKNQNGKKHLAVALFGSPNAGKSTFTNTAVGQRVSIVSNKAQTTQQMVKGILTEGNTQIIFIDTPGVFRARKGFDRERQVSKIAWHGVRSAEFPIIFIDGTKGMDVATEDVIADLKRREARAIAVINKIDLMDTAAKITLGLQIEASGVIDEIFYISALNGKGTEKLIKALKKAAEQVGHEGFLFDESEVTDTSLEFNIAEAVREQIFIKCFKEVPYGVQVTVEDVMEGGDGAIFTKVLVSVAKEAHKGIVIGGRGVMLTAIKRNSEETLWQMYNIPFTVRLTVVNKGNAFS